MYCLTKDRPLQVKGAHFPEREEDLNQDRRCSHPAPGSHQLAGSARGSASCLVRKALTKDVRMLAFHRYTSLDIPKKALLMGGRARRTPMCSTVQDRQHSLQSCSEWPSKHSSRTVKLRSLCSSSGFCNTASSLT